MAGEEKDPGIAIRVQVSCGIMLVNSVVRLSWGLVALAAWTPAPAQEPEVVDDAALKRRIERSLDRLARDEATATMAQLREQLGRKRHSLELAAAPEGELSGAQIHRLARAATLVVSKRYKCSSCNRWHFSHASGYLIHESGVFVTSHHVLEADENGVVAVTAADGTVHPVDRVLVASEPDDLVVVKLRGDGPFPYLPLGKGPPVGRAIYSLSHPDRRFYHFTDGIVSRYFAENGRQVRMAVTADHARGSSGGPVLDGVTGAVVGTIAATRSVYYSEEHGEQKNLQMVFKTCIPVAALRALVAPE